MFPRTCMSSLAALFDSETPASPGRCSVQQATSLQIDAARSLDAFSLWIFFLVYLHPMPFAQTPTLHPADGPIQPIVEVVAKAVSAGEEEETEPATERRCSPADTSRNNISLCLPHGFQMVILKSKSRPEVGKQQTKLGIKKPVTSNSRPAGQERETREQAIPMIISEPEAG